MNAALDRLDAGSRALLDLSIRRGVADEEIAEVLRSDPADVAQRRETILAQVAEDVGSNGPELVERVKTALKELPPEQLRPQANGGGPEADDEVLDGEVMPEETASAKWGFAHVPVDREPAVESEAEELPPEPGASAETPVEEPPVEEEPVHEASAESAPAEEGDPGFDEEPEESTAPAPAVTRKRDAPPPPRVGGTRLRSSRMPALLGLLAAAVLITVLILIAGGEDDPDVPTPPAQTQPTGGGTALEAIGGRGKARASIVDRTLTMSVSGLPAAKGSSYEVWLYNSVADARSVRRFEKGSASFDAELPADPAAYRFLDISLEPADGNPNHSGQSVLRAPVQRLVKP